MDCCCPASSWLRDLQKGPRGSRHGLLVSMTLSNSGYGVCPLPTTPLLGSYRADGQSTEQAHGEQGRVLPLKQIQKPGLFRCCYTQTSLESTQHHANQNRAERFVLSSFPVLIFPCNSLQTSPNQRVWLAWQQCLYKPTPPAGAILPCPAPTSCVPHKG